MKTSQRKKMEKFLSKGNVIESPDRERDWGIFSAVKEDDEAEVPKSFSLYGRQGFNHWWAREVENQRQTGACVGFAGAAMLREQLVGAKKATRSSRDSQHPSEQDFWMSSKEMDPHEENPTTGIQFAGTYIKSISDVARKFGCLSRAAMPFGRLTKLPEAKVIDLRSRWKIKSYHAVSMWVEGKNQFNEFGLKWWLVNHGPVITRLNVNVPFFEGKPKGGILDDVSKKTPYGHAILIVAYNEFGVLIRNSWGKRWGECGHLWVSWRYARLMFTESYGWVVEPKEGRLAA